MAEKAEQAVATVTINIDDPLNAHSWSSALKLRNQVFDLKFVVTTTIAQASSWISPYRPDKNLNTASGAYLAPYSQLPAAGGWATEVASSNAPTAAAVFTVNMWIFPANPKPEEAEALAQKVKAIEAGNPGNSADIIITVDQMQCWRGPTEVNQDYPITGNQAPLYRCEKRCDAGLSTGSTRYHNLTIFSRLYGP